MIVEVSENFPTCEPSQRWPSWLPEQKSIIVIVAVVVIKRSIITRSDVLSKIYIRGNKWAK